ncbi:PREDICTED: AT-hook motif nuclear-localized protein 9-like isoform X2 [Ipomoea nil]|uniref:AT-hook motif nuclear-localized protein 9-like isoform X2 n=1 Tax=Ipomoea nil TaxID=35883 RepID=UPI000900E770|nr:PREDICTED: AT-hook motif nuclear-localized protein 9-like isoform X2 [Ipomoea nil]
MLQYRTLAFHNLPLHQTMARRKLGNFIIFCNFFPRKTVVFEISFCKVLKFNSNGRKDVVQTILAHFRNIPRPSQEYLGVVLSATGSVLNPAISTRLLTKSFEGAFPIAHLTGHFIIKRTGRVEPRQGLNITFRGSDGEMVGGRVEGSLIAATKIQLCVGRFPHEAN